MSVLNCSVARVIPAVDSEDGAGVKLKRSLGRGPTTRLDPFLMLDAFSSDNPNDYIGGFPPHPHRGFETVTYMLDGHMVHRDHMGNEGVLCSGGVQWMSAGRGVIHEERPQRVDGLMRGFQLWINLPSVEKMKPAAYQNINPEQVPEYKKADGTIIKVIAGEFEVDDVLLKGVVSSSSTEPQYFDLQLAANNEIVLPVNTSHNAFLYVFEGEVFVGNGLLESNAVTVLGQGDTVRLRTSDKNARLLFLSGNPIGEPVAQYGPFVMNTMEEVEQAISDYREGWLTGG